MKTMFLVILGLSASMMFTSCVQDEPGGPDTYPQGQGTYGAGNSTNNYYGNGGVTNGSGTAPAGGYAMYGSITDKPAGLYASVNASNGRLYTAKMMSFEFDILNLFNYHQVPVQCTIDSMPQDPANPNTAYEWQIVGIVK